MNKPDLQAQLANIEEAVDRAAAKSSNMKRTKKWNTI